MENLKIHGKKESLLKQIDDAKILELYNQGFLHREMAQQLGYGVSTVTRHLLNMGHRTIMPVDKDEVVQLHLYGVSDADIAKIVGCTRSNVTIILNRAGYTDCHSKIDNIELRNRISNSLIGRYTGTDNPNYKGYTDEKTVARGIFKTISKRKIRGCNYTCKACGKRGGDMETHHIKPFSLIFKEFLSNRYDGNIQTIYEQLMDYPDFVDEDNMVVLCHDCHHDVHYSDYHELSPYRWESATTIERVIQ